MNIIVPLAVILVVGVYSLYWYQSDNRHPLTVKPEKRTYMYEDEDGNRRNPFSDDSEDEKSEDSIGSSEETEFEYKYQPQHFD